MFCYERNGPLYHRTLCRSIIIGYLSIGLFLWTWKTFFGCQNEKFAWKIRSAEIYQKFLSYGCINNGRCRLAIVHKKVIAKTFDFICSTFFSSFHFQKFVHILSICSPLCWQVKNYQWSTIKSLSPEKYHHNTGSLCLQEMSSFSSNWKYPSEIISQKCHSSK